jgi:hypothetical protein
MNAETKIKAGGVHRKLSTARQTFHALKLEKTGKNTFAGYSYFELGDFLIPALQVFDQVGLGAVISFTTDLATMTIVDLDNPTDTILVTSPMGSAALKGCHEVQNIGAVETYQRRYLWSAALEIVEHDAIDRTTGKDQPEKTKATAPKMIQDGQRDLIQTLAPAASKTVQGICEAYKIPALTGLTEAQAAKLIERLQSEAKEPVNA